MMARQGTCSGMMRRRSSQALTQDKTLTTTRALESAARIGGTYKSNNKLDDDGKRGCGSGRKQLQQQQHGWTTTVYFSKMTNDNKGTMEATTFAPRQRPGARRPSRTAGTTATRLPKLRRRQPPATGPIAWQGHCRRLFFLWRMIW